MNDRFTMTFSM